MNRKEIKVVKFAGIMFMGVSTIMFYNHLFTAASNPGFYVTIYFDYFGEGLVELLLFTAFIPIISFTIFYEIWEAFKWKNC